MEKVKAVAVEKVNWSKYFDHIKKVCPWAYVAYKKNEIKITQWSGKSESLDNYQAIVYIVLKTNRRRLKKLAKKLDTSKECEWLWSEPTNGDYAAPIHILIQQNRRKLFEARFNTGYYDDMLG